MYLILVTKMINTDMYKCFLRTIRDNIMRVYPDIYTKEELYMDLLVLAKNNNINRWNFSEPSKRNNFIEDVEFLYGTKI